MIEKEPPPVSRIIETARTSSPTWLTLEAFVRTQVQRWLNGPITLPRPRVRSLDARFVSRILELIFVEAPDSVDT